MSYNFINTRPYSPPHSYFFFFYSFILYIVLEYLYKFDYLFHTFINFRSTTKKLRFWSLPNYFSYLFFSILFRIFCGFFLSFFFPFPSLSLPIPFVFPSVFFHRNWYLILILYILHVKCNTGLHTYICMCISWLVKFFPFNMNDIRYNRMDKTLIISNKNIVKVQGLFNLSFLSLKDVWEREVCPCWRGW